MALPTVNKTRTLILLDVDGVLVHPVGYKSALKATVNHFATAMGLPAFGPDEDEIAVFEACGITNEWDSGAICVAMMMLAALRTQSGLHRPTLETTFAAIRAAGVTIERPDFVGASREIERTTKRIQAEQAAAGNVHAVTEKQMPSRVFLDGLNGQLDTAERALVTELLQDVYDLTTPTTRIFQSYVLGHAHFAETYQQNAPIESDSFLKTCDMPLLTTAMRDRLIAWHAQPGNGATVFTARPSLPPASLDSPAPSVYSPEAEIAAELLGLDGAIPLIAQGRVGWIAEKFGRMPSDYVKPSPVQALAAMGAAATGDQLAALQAAAALVENGELTGPLADLAHETVRVILFEDSITGIRAVQLAVEHLRRAGITVQFESIGISPHAAKRATLDEHASYVVDDVNQGLALVLDT